MRTRFEAQREKLSRDAEKFENRRDAVLVKMTHSADLIRHLPNLLDREEFLRDWMFFSRNLETMTPEGMSQIEKGFDYLLDNIQMVNRKRLGYDPKKPI